MKNVSELKQILGDFLDWNNARLTCFTKMLVALLAVRTVNLFANILPQSRITLDNIRITSRHLR